MKKILFLVRYDQNGPSSRVRCFQYLDYFKKHSLHELHFEIQALFSEEYIQRLYHDQKKPFWTMFKGYCKRLLFLLTALDQYDFVWIEKELFPYCPARIERWLLRKKKFALDYDDAIFHNYDLHCFHWVRTLFGKKIATLMHQSSIVYSGNAYLAQYASAAQAPEIVLLPTVVDLEKYVVAPVEAEKEVPVIGWIGSPATQKNLFLLAGVFSQLQKIRPFKLVLIGAHPEFSMSACDYEIWPWTEETEVALLQKIDIGIMPLIDEPFERGKCGYKLIQYMACCKPVVASPVGVNCELIESDVNGFLAENPQAWLDPLLRLLENPLLRKTLGDAGRKKVEAQYCLQHTAPLFFSTLKKSMR